MIAWDRQNECNDASTKLTIVFLIVALKAKNIQELQWTFQLFSNKKWSRSQFWLMPLAFTRWAPAQQAERFLNGRDVRAVKTRTEFDSPLSRGGRRTCHHLPPHWYLSPDLATMATNDQGDAEVFLQRATLRTASQTGRRIPGYKQTYGKRDHRPAGNWQKLGNELESML